MFGQEQPVSDFSRGLVLQVERADLPDGALAVAENVSHDELGAVKKRSGYVHYLHRQYTNQITGIIPIENRFGNTALIIAHAGYDIGVEP